MNTITPIEHCTSSFDQALRQIPRLGWLPWVGAEYPGEGQGLIIVGESHYVGSDSAGEVQRELRKHHDWPTYTREVVSECPINREWSNPTLDKIAPLLLGSEPGDNLNLWKASAFYNFVQRPMSYRLGETPERPSWEDWVSGWGVFLDVVRVLRPGFCLFIGVEAFNAFPFSMEQAGAETAGITRVSKIDNTWARSATVRIDGNPVHLAGIKHTGKYFTTAKWRDYLVNHEPGLVSSISSSN